MQFKAAVCGALGLLCATASGYRRVENVTLRFSAELPRDWAEEGPGKDAYKPTAKGAVPSGIDVILLDEGTPLSHVRAAADPSKELRAARRSVEFKAKPIEKRGAWLIVETYEKKEKGEVEYSIHAAQAAAGGYFAASFWAAGEDAFKNGQPVFEHWLDTFKRTPGP